MIKKRYVIVIILVVLAVFISQNNYMVLLFNNLSHRISQPKDLFEPIIVKKFDFTKKGHTDTLDFNPKYYDIYAISLIVRDSDYSKSIDYAGVVKLEVFDGNQKLFEELKRGANATILGQHQIDILTFEVPVKSFNKGNLKIRLEVIESADTFKVVADSLYLQVSVSSIP